VVLLAACGGNDSNKTPAGGAPTGSPLGAACQANQTCLDDGLRYEDVKVGTGTEAKKGDTVKVDYVGMLTDGTVFDASKKHPPGYFSFKLGAGMVIQGWDEGVPGMKVGGERKLTIPPALGYGSAGYPPTIPPNSTLIFDIKLLGVKSGK
jgi:peptidylprolyl isomerase/FKBP-type peptidyl-prolyl cis-trans isomerase FkpA